MREYRFQATTDTMEALRKLRGAWRGISIGEHEVTVVLRDGQAVRVGIDTADVEGLFDAYRIRAEVEANAGVLGIPVEDFIDGNNDVVLFTGVTWSEPHGSLMAEGMSEGSAMHFSGHPGQLSETAEVVCVTTDAFVVASAAGRGMLLRTGLRPGSIEVERNPEKVRAFLLERGYEG
ncbi:hypothetical protein [Gemmatimonas sp.]|uniref:hypothetical protein n=1 Tax=Gemmatimonas sp. TaxID=1962908 RepID=UPI0037C143D6